MSRVLISILVYICLVNSAAADVYQEPSAFIADAFSGDPPPPARVWITKGLRDQASAVLGHSPSALRYSYWRRGERTVWILDEIGKEQPITAGFVIDSGRITVVRVLIFRESRGWEIRYPFFTDQFTGIMLGPNDRLDGKIDGISGATLSVNALVRLTRLALLLNRHISSGK